jgi:hypothetical protein
MERKRSRDGAMESQPNDFFIDGAMLVLNFNLHTWRITIGPNCRALLESLFSM